MSHYILLIFCVFHTLSAFANKNPVSTALPEPEISSSAYAFEENKGQFPAHVHFRARFGSKSLYVEQGRLKWYSAAPIHATSYDNCTHFKCMEEGASNTRYHVHQIVFEGASNDYLSKGVDSSYMYINYLKGQDTSNWATHVYTFRQTRAMELYEGIDFHLYQYKDRLKYDFVASPGADLSQIRMRVDYADEVFLKDESLYIITSIDTFIEKAPYAYQRIKNKKRKIACSFQLDSNVVSFSFQEDVDPRYSVIIDPELVFSTLSGSLADNWGSTATPGLNDEFFGGGIAFNPGYPTNVGAFQPNFTPGTESEALESDIAIMKITPDGRAIEYATYIGGTGTEIPHSIIVNSRNEVVIFGTTSSVDFPGVGNGAFSRFGGGNDFQENAILFKGGTDIYIAVLSAAGDDLVGATYVGGSGNDGVNRMTDNQQTIAANYGDEFRGEVIIDAEDNIYVTSTSLSNDFPTSFSAFQRNRMGQSDAVIFSLNRRCNSLRFSTYYGGQSTDGGHSIKRGKDGQIYICGGTRSDDLDLGGIPSIDNTYGGRIDGYIARFNEDASALLNATYIGTQEYDQAYILALDSDGEVYVFGQTFGNIAVSPGVYSNIGGSQFIQKFAPDLSQTRLSTRIGSGRTMIDISPTALMIDTCQRVFLSGWGGSVNGNNNMGTTGLPISRDAFQSRTDGSDFYFMVLERDFQELIYGTYFGGSATQQNQNEEHVDGGTSRFSDKGVIYQAVCANCGGSNGFPTTAGVIARQNRSQRSLDPTRTGCNMGAIKFDFQLSQLIAAADLVLDTFGCAPYNAEFINNSVGADSYFWDFGDGSTSTEQSPSHLYDSIGTYDVRLIARSDNSCLAPDTLDIVIDIILAEPPNFVDTLVCDAQRAILQSSRPQGASTSYIWNTGEVTRSKLATTSGIYAVTATASNCVFVDSFDLTLIDLSTRPEDQNLCGESEFTIELDVRAENIQWSTGETGSSIFVDEAGLYTVSYNVDECEYNDTARIEFPSIPEVDIIGRDTACFGESISLEVVNQSQAIIEEYNWSNQDRGPIIDVSESGTYTVNVLSDSGCVFSTDKEVYFIPLFPTPNLGDTLICADSELNVDLSFYEEENQIIWFDGRTDAVRTFTNTGLYSVQIINRCQQIEEEFALEVSPYSSSDRPYYIPNAFSPNGDEINDVFKIEVSDQMRIRNYQMLVYDRWGDELFESLVHPIGWDGSFKLREMDPGVFAYIIRFNFFVCEQWQNAEEVGDITIVK